MGPKRSQSRTSAEIIAGNDDLLMETILLRLPAKPLIRFQLVCKLWQSLIYAPSFTRNHTRRRCHKPNFSFILRPNPPHFFYFSPICRVFYQFHFDSPYTKILQSCNGLLLLESRNSKYGQKNYCVYNPTTNQFRTVEIERIRNVHVSGVCLAFDPSISLHYKIVCVYNPDYSVEVYDSEPEEWTSMGTPFPHYTNTKFMNGIYWNNRIYWFRPTSKSFYFDLQTGKVGTAPGIKTPSRKRGEINKNHIIESNGHVHCVSIYLSCMANSLFVFELLGDSSGWFELHRFDLNPIPDTLMPEMMNGAGLVSVLGFVRGDETKQEWSVFFHVPGKVISYRFCDGSFEVVLDLETSYGYNKGRLQFSRHDTFQFIESLAPV